MLHLTRLRQRLTPVRSLAPARAHSLSRSRNARALRICASRQDAANFALIYRPMLLFQDLRQRELSSFDGSQPK